jgi:hypothetical protein
VVMRQIDNRHRTPWRVQRWRRPATILRRRADNKADDSNARDAGAGDEW